MEWPYFYVVGGTTGYIYNTDVHRLDLRTCVWTCLFDSHSKDDTEHPIGRLVIVNHAGLKTNSINCCYIIHIFVFVFVIF